jgi:hypothetical protein
VCVGEHAQAAAASPLMTSTTWCFVVTGVAVDAGLDRRLW